MSKLSWEPVRHATVYCAPACGGGCTLEAHDEAVKKAAALAKKLGPAWKPHVWENLGWHYSAICGSSSVSPLSDKMYWASVNCGRQFQGENKDPRKAVAEVLTACDNAMRLWQKERDDLRKAGV